MRSWEAPAWLPYRVRLLWDRSRLSRAIGALKTSTPIPAASPEHADAEVHMLLCRRDLDIGVLSLKSLLRFSEARWAVTLTNDGSISPNHQRWINDHVPGCAWLPYVSSDPKLTAALSNLPRVRALYEGSFALMRKLIHPIVLARHEKVVALDSDTAFWQPPRELIDWSRTPRASALYLHDRQDEATRAPAEFWEAFEQLRRIAGSRAASWKLPHAFFNAGLLAYEPARLDLSLVEDYLSWLDSAPARFKEGKPGLWFGSWTREQSSYQLMFACMTPTPLPFGDGYRIGKTPGDTFNHFLGLELTKPLSLKILRQLSLELPRRT